MSEENVEIVRRFFDATERAMSSYWRDPRSITEAYEADDLTAEGEEALSFFDPGIVWKAGGFGTFQGIKEMLSAWDDIFEIADGYRTSVRELREGEGRPRLRSRRPRNHCEGERHRGDYPCVRSDQA